MIRRKGDILHPTDNTKICSICNIEKEFNMFNKNKHQKDGYRCECRECQNKKNIQYKIDNQDKIKVSNKKYYWDNYEKFKIKRDNNKETKNEYMKNYVKTERGKKLREIRDMKRRALEKNSYCNGTVTQENLDNKLLIQNSKCVYCNIDISNRKDRHLDHIYPLSKGGSHIIDNVQWTCVKCNLLKSDKLEEDFLILFNNILG